MIIYCPAVLSQVSFQISDHCVDTSGVIAENATPIPHKHYKDQAPECIFLVGHHLQEYARYEVHSLTVAGFWVVRAIRLQYVIEAINSTFYGKLELLVAWESTIQVLYDFM